MTVNMLRYEKQLVINVLRLVLQLSVILLIEDQMMVHYGELEDTLVLKQLTFQKSQHQV